MALLTPEYVYRLYDTAGVPESGKHDPKKGEIIQLLNQLFGTSRGGWVVTRTLSELNGVTPESETDGGVVLTGAGAGYYDRDAGAWIFGRGFPDTFARVDLDGSGTVQTGIVNAGVNPATTEVFFAKVETPNTGALTLSIGGEPARPVINLAGNPLSPGEWTGMVMFYLTDDEEYQLLIDAGAAGSAAASAAAAAGAFRDFDKRYLGAKAADPATDNFGDPLETGALYYNTVDGKFRVWTGSAWQDQSTALSDGEVTEPKLADSLALMLSNVVASRTALKALSTSRWNVAYLAESGREGTFKWQLGNYSAQVTADTAEGIYVKANAIAATVGAWVRTSSQTVSIKWFGAVGDGVADDTAAIRAAMAASKSVVFPPGVFKLSDDLPLADNHKIALDAGTRINQTVDNKNIFNAIQKVGVTLLCNNAELWGFGNYSSSWTGTNGHDDIAIQLFGCTDALIDLPRIRDCSMAGISIRGGNGITIRNPDIEGTHTHGSPIAAEANIQSGIFIQDAVTYGVTTGLQIQQPRISGVAQGVLNEAYAVSGGMDYTSRTIQIDNPQLRDIPGQHAFYLQSGGITITNPQMRNIKLAGVKVQSSADNNLNIRRVVVTGASAFLLGSNMFEIVNLGSGSIADVLFDGVGEGVLVGAAIVGDVRNVRGVMHLRTVGAQAVYIGGTGPTDIDITCSARDMSQEGALITCVNGAEIKLRPNFKNTNTGATGKCGILINAPGSDIELYSPVVKGVTASPLNALRVTAGTVVIFGGKQFASSTGPLIVANTTNTEAAVYDVYT